MLADIAKECLEILVRTLFGGLFHWLKPGESAKSKRRRESRRRKRLKKKK